MPRANRDFGSGITRGAHLPPLKLRFQPDHFLHLTTARTISNAKMIF